MKSRLLILTAVALVAGTLPGFARTWTDSTGKYKVIADFVDCNETVVRLKKSDGTVIRISIEKLSERDQAYVKTIAAKRAADDDSRPGSDDEPREAKKTLSKMDPRVATAIGPLRAKVGGVRSKVYAAVKTKAEERLKQQGMPDGVSGEEQQAIEKAQASLQQITELAGELGRPASGPPMPGIEGEVTVGAGAVITGPDGKEETVMVSPANASSLLSQVRTLLSRAQRKARTGARNRVSAAVAEERRNHKELFDELADLEKMPGAAAKAIEKVVDDEAKVKAELDRFGQQIDEAVQSIAEQLEQMASEKEEFASEAEEETPQAVPPPEEEGEAIEPEPLGEAESPQEGEEENEGRGRRRPASKRPARD